MRVNDVLLESQPKTLYHGTLKVFLPDILDFGLQPSLGAFVKHAYNEYRAVGIPLEYVIFASDRQGLGKCVSAIIGQLRQHFDEIDPITSEEFYKHAVIVVMKHAEHRFKYKSIDDQSLDHPPQAEPEDYYRKINIMPDYILTDKRLRNFLRRNDIRLDDYGIQDANIDTAELVRKKLIKNP